MKSTGRTVWTPFVRAFLATGVIACLCFSAGEGLRLTPLPALPLEGALSSGLRVAATLSPGTPGYLAGPLDLPAKGQVQKRGKRQMPDCGCPPPGEIREIPYRLLGYPGFGYQIARASHLPDEQSAGRAPPLTS